MFEECLRGFVNGNLLVISDRRVLGEEEEVRM